MLYYNQQEGRKPNERKVEVMKLIYITMKEYCEMLSDEASKMKAQGLTEEEILHNIADFMYDLFKVKGYRLAKD